jgi:hypothetical protein
VVVVVVGDVGIVMRGRMEWRAEQVPQRQVVGKRREVGEVSSEGRWEGWGGMEAGGRFGGVVRSIVVVVVVVVVVLMVIIAVVSMDGFKRRGAVKVLKEGDGFVFGDGSG